MKNPCTHGAPFSSLLSRNGSCLSRQDILGLEVDGMDQAAAHCSGRSTPSCAHETANACVREHSTLPRRLSLPGLIVMTFPEVEFKKNSILATLGEFCLSGLRGVFAGFCKFQVVLEAGPRCHSAP